MGMDVIGIAPTNAVGQYFRNNVWWWHPLWEYCARLEPELCETVLGHSNDGDGLDSQGALRLAEVLQGALDRGDVDEYAAQRTSQLAALPRQRCRWCDGGGIRTDAVGVELGMPEEVLEPHLAIALGRDRGWCNGCRGEGLVDDPALSYQFDVENVTAFLEFLKACGGFQIW